MGLLEQIIDGLFGQSTPKSWKDDVPTDRQLEFAEDLGIDVRADATRGNVSKMIDMKLRNNRSFRSRWDDPELMDDGNGDEEFLEYLED